MNTTQVLPKMVSDFIESLDRRNIAYTLTTKNSDWCEHTKFFNFNFERKIGLSIQTVTASFVHTEKHYNEYGLRKNTKDQFIGGYYCSLGFNTDLKTLWMLDQYLNSNFASEEVK